MLGRMESREKGLQSRFGKVASGPLSASGTPTKDTAPIQDLEFMEAFQSITYGHESASVIQTDWNKHAQQIKGLYVRQQSFALEPQKMKTQVYLKPREMSKPLCNVSLGRRMSWQMHSSDR